MNNGACRREEEVGGGLFERVVAWNSVAVGHGEESDTSFLSREQKCPREKSQWRENAARNEPVPNDNVSSEDSESTPSDLTESDDWSSSEDMEPTNLEANQIRTRATLEDPEDSDED